jgi:hypothetical protein
MMQMKMPLIEWTALLDDLRRDGVVIAPSRFGEQELAEMIAYMDERPVWRAHVASRSKVPEFPAGSKTMRQARSDGEWPAFAPTMETVVGAPHWLECAISVFPLVKQYFDGEFPRLYSLHCFWTQPGSGHYIETHDWHRDEDDRKQLGLFMFGTDVLNDGFHLYQRGSSHSPANGNPPPEAIITIKGPAGTLFVEQPFGVHMGQRPRSGPRLFIWARYGVSDPPAAYGWDDLRPVPKALIGDRYPADPEIQEAIRLVVS